MSTASKNIYFASDFHLGVPDKETSRKREMLLVSWLDSIGNDAKEIYLVGDIFDFWYEYKTVVPKGFVRFQAKLAELTDKGINVHIFIGNHDMWMFNYFEEELGVTMHRKPITTSWNGKKFFIGHGDGLGPGDHAYKIIKKVFTNPVCIWFFKWLHPDIGVGLANFWSGRSRKSNLESDSIYNGDENEWLLQFCKTKLKEEHFDYFIFGHRHMVLDKSVGENARYINLGAWFKNPYYGVWNGENLELRKVAD